MVDVTTLLRQSATEITNLRKQLTDANAERDAAKKEAADAKAEAQTAKDQLAKEQPDIPAADAVSALDGLLNPPAPADPTNPETLPAPTETKAP